MSYSYTASESTTFTVTHARYIAAKVAADLKRLQRFYGKPKDALIDDYEEEAIELLKAGYLKTVTYGFKRAGKWVEPTLQYVADDFSGADTDDDDPGKVRPTASVKGASFSSYLTYSAAWYDLSKSERDSFKERLPLQRVEADEPGINGYLNQDNTYSSGGKKLSRSSLRSYS